MTKDIIETCELHMWNRILMGQTSTQCHLARQLTLLGINSLYQTTVGIILSDLRMPYVPLGRSDSVIITGGLGPTEDDISMAVAARVAIAP